MIDAQEIAVLVRNRAWPGCEVEDVYPLSPLQEGILFHRLLHSQSDVYVLTTSFQLQSSADVVLLRRALQEVVDRYPALRTAVQWEDLPSPVQVVHSSAALPVEDIELRADRDPREQLDQLAGQRSRLFDLQRAPLLRLLVATGARDGHIYAVLQVHHIICDHQSLRELVAEVLSRIAGAQDQLPPPLAYRDYVAQVLAGAERSEDEAFFRAKLHDVEDSTAPFGLLDVHSGGLAVTDASCELDAPLTDAIRRQAEKSGVSAARLLHAAAALVVAHTSGRDDVVFGTVVRASYRRGLQPHRALGLFVNTLPLRLSLRDRSVEEFVRHTDQELRELLRHEHAPLTLAQRCSGSGAGPLFTLLFNYRHSPASERTRAGGVCVLARGEAGSNYPISIIVDDLGRTFGITTMADQRLDPARITAYLEEALRSLVDALEYERTRAVRRLSIVPQAERLRLLEHFNATAAPYPGERTVHDVFEEQAARTPDAVAVVSGKQSLTYAQLNRRANQLARLLRAHGVGPDKLVGLCIDRSIDIAVSLFGILKAGGAYVPLDPSNPSERLEFMLRDAAPQVLLTQSHLRGRLPALHVQVITLDEQSAQIEQQPAGNLLHAEVGVGPQHLAYIIYTSGSTGRPKGVCIEHASVLNTWQGIERMFRRVPCTRIALNASLNFDASVQQFVQWLSGRTLYIVPHDVRRDGSLLLEFIDEHRIESIDATPAQLKALLAAGLLGRPGCPLRVVPVGGEAIDAPTWAQLSACRSVEFFNVYGPTEITVETTMAPICGDVTPPHIGWPMPNRRLYILDALGEPVPIGAIGEICIGGAGVARGYLNRPELTAERFVRDPFAGDLKARMYKSGDLGRWRADGAIEYLGRNDNQVKIRGYRIELGEIETQLLRDTRLREAVVVAREDVPGEKSLVAYIVAADAASVPGVEELRSYSKAVLPEYMVPTAFVLLDRMPLTGSGKVDRRGLPAPKLDAFVSYSCEPPRGSTEERLAHIWRELLRLGQVGRNYHFFEVGGNSLTVMRLIVRVAQSFSVPFSAQDVFRNPTLAAMAEVIDRSMPIEGPALQGDATEYEQGVL